jgi:fructose/tagatose bisphosphate aldolase
VGNIHGAISGTAAGETKVHARLNLDHLDRLREATGGIPLVLHGGSGIQLEYLQGAVARGIAKINVGTEIRQAYEAGLALDDQVEQGQLAVAMVIRRLVDDYGIAGSAARLAEA